MNSNVRCVMAAAVAAVVSSAATAAVEFGSPFADGMVLQRDMDVAVWGTAEAGEQVEVSFAGATAGAKADGEGRWLVRLPKMAASKEGRVLKASAPSGEKSVSDVLVGEVWYCCGQSNTEMPLVGGNPHFSDRDGLLVAQMTHKPFVRFSYASNYRWSASPKKKAAYKVEWKKFTPENLRGRSFSAMGVYFALNLYSELDVPVGIVGSYWGGTNIDAWTPREGYAGHEGELKDTVAWKVVGKDGWNDGLKRGPISAPQQQPTVLWNEMVEPWCPMSMRGFIWYQGCHNAGEPHLYCAKMHALYDGWSRKFENPGLKLYFVQLAPFSGSWFKIQLAQAQFAAEEKNAGMAVAVDVGNSFDIHPNEKGILGRRLAALALARDYGFTDIVADSPTLKGVCSEEGRLILAFYDAKGWRYYAKDWGVDYGFEIAGPDGQWKTAYIVNANKGAKQKTGWKTNGVVEGRDLMLAADGVEKPMKVRYLYKKPWIGGLFADSGLPLGPFEAEVK
ncbi:MAG: hypothetical protein IJI73_04600 [Kiritimatiellae bacterium]|nr:hypothetical protein [Kiritimatiellia bacterium]